MTDEQAPSENVCLPRDLVLLLLDQAARAVSHGYRLNNLANFEDERVENDLETLQETIDLVAHTLADKE